MKKVIKPHVWIEAILLLILETVFSSLPDSVASFDVERMSFFKIKLVGQVLKLGNKAIKMRDPRNLQQR